MYLKCGFDELITSDKRVKMRNHEFYTALNCILDQSRLYFGPSIINNLWGRKNPLRKPRKPLNFTILLYKLVLRSVGYTDSSCRTSQIFAISLLCYGYNEFIPRFLKPTKSQNFDDQFFIIVYMFTCCQVAKPCKKSWVFFKNERMKNEL